MDDVTGDIAESPTASETPAESGQAPSAPVAAPARSQTVPYERFQQVNSQMRQYQQQTQQLAQRLQQLEQKANQPGQPRSVEEAVARQQARESLRELLAEDPELKNLLDLAKNGQSLTQGYQTVHQIQEAQQQAQARQAESHIKGLAKDAKLSSDPKFLTRLVRSVAIEAASMPGGRERFDSGDLSVLDEAFAALKGDFAVPAAAASVLATKQNVTKLPPRPGGGGPGQEPPPSLDPVTGDAKKFMDKAGERAMALLGRRG